MRAVGKEENCRQRWNKLIVELCSKSAKGNLRESDIKSARSLVSERAKGLGEKRLVDLNKEIESL
jgi:hypothetical protein